MEPEVIALALAGLAVAGVWTLWSLNTGRRMSRWYRIRMRRVAFALAAIAALIVYLSASI